MFIKNFLILFLLGAFLNISVAQSLVPGELVIQLKERVDSDQFFDNIYQNRTLSTELQEYKEVSSSLRLHLLKYEANRVNIDQLIQTLRQHTEIQLVGQNFRFELRDKDPNDLLFDQQWGLDVINAPEVWDCSTGGTTILGDTIVVANLEGCDIHHEDIQSNIWINHNEIPNDGIDNDGNSYIDDYFGYNVDTQNGSHDFNNQHGTQTAGIIGARGDNDVGISGVNWHIKVMVVSNNLQFDQIISSYQYVLDQRTLYNQTGGDKGAFVVATNASFGAPGFPEDNPFYGPWCNMYDLLGEQGVLSAGATTNSKVDIDDIGDMPTSCSSDFLIAVTDLDQSNDLRGGFSPTMVDLGAPGTTSQAISPFNGYVPITGTSAATPHVSGGIGLLYSMPCDAFAQLALDNPREAALKMKRYILDGAIDSPVPALEGKTLTGGVLNLESSMNHMQDDCGSPTGNLELLKIFPNPTGSTIGSLVTVEYQTPDNAKYDIRVFNTIGQLVYVDSVEPVKFEEKKFTLDISSWRAGVYTITIENISNIKSARFIVH